MAALVAEFGPAKALRAYLLLIATIGAVQALLWAYAAFPGRLVDDTIDRRERFLVLVRYLIAPVLLGISGVLQNVGRSPVSAGVLMVLVIGAVVARRFLGALPSQGRLNGRDQAG